MVTKQERKKIKKYKSVKYKQEHKQEIEKAEAWEEMKSRVNNLIPKTANDEVLWEEGDCFYKIPGFKIYMLSELPFAIYVEIDGEPYHWEFEIWLPCLWYWFKVKRLIRQIKIQLYLNGKN